MKKQLAIFFASLLFLGASSFLWSDNPDERCISTPVYTEPYTPGCPPPGRPAVHPSCPMTDFRQSTYPVGGSRMANCPIQEEQSCHLGPMQRDDAACNPLPRCKYSNQAELVCKDGITVTARNPVMCMQGEQYPLEFDIKACENVCDVVVTAHLPEGVTYVRSAPEAQVDCHTLIWDIGSMSQGQSIPAKVWLRCDCEGELCACFCATASPVRFCSLLCAKPQLTCSKCGPDEVCPGDPVNYIITVTNRGSCAAEDVVVTDNVPDGLEHNSCLRTLTYRLGTLQPCESRTVNVNFTAVKRGKAINTAVVTACNGDSAACQWVTNVCKECVELYKTGPREAQIGHNAEYVITVVNPGDKPLTDVVVTDWAPRHTTIVEAPGGSINSNQAMWRFKDLRPGEKVSLNLVLTSCTLGCRTNRVSVNNAQGCCATAEWTTKWRGRPALNVCVADSSDPVCIGDNVSYNIAVTNQGSEADNNVQVVVKFPKEIKPFSATGCYAMGQVSDQTVTFAPFNNLRPRQTINYRVDAQARTSGDARVIVEVSSESIPTPITQQESTIIN